MCLSHHFSSDNQRRRKPPSPIIRESPVRKQDDALRCSPDPDSGCCPLSSTLCPPVCPTAGIRLTLKVQTGSSSAPPHPTLDLVYVARAERAKWGWDIPTSRCLESIGPLLCHTGLIYANPLSGCLATTVFVGYSTFRFDVVLHGCSRFALLLFLLPF